MDSTLIQFIQTLGGSEISGLKMGKRISMLKDNIKHLEQKRSIIIFLYCH